MNPLEAAPPSPSSSLSDEPLALLVEDDQAMAEVLSTALMSRSFRTCVAGTGQRALDLAFELEPDIVILDLGLPDIDGSDVCRHLRRWYRGPIVVLSADGDEDRKIEALDEGADDYVTKPFSMRELLARVRVALRHGAAVAQAADPTVISVGDLQVDRDAHVATLAGVPLPLARKEFALLAELARHRGRVLTHKALLAQVWGTADPAKTETLRVHVNQLRRKLGDGPRRPQLLTAAGVGYRLVEPGDP